MSPLRMLKPPTNFWRRRKRPQAQLLRLARQGRTCIRPVPGSLVVLRGADLLQPSLGAGEGVSVDILTTARGS